MVGKLMVALWVCAWAAFAGDALAGPLPEYNPVRRHQIAIGPQAERLLVAFRTTADNAEVHTIRGGSGRRTIRAVQARTTPGDVAALARRSRLVLADSRQLTPSMHVLYLRATLYGAAVTALLDTLRADPVVKFADVDQRRFAHTVPNDPLYLPTANAAGQWYMMTPSSATPSSDAAATDAVSAWSITTGSTGTVIADVDTGVRFEHPDLLRAGRGGRLLPGYDFVAGDLSSTGVALGTYLIANDGDGWDPDPSDPGDWINSADQANSLFPAADCPIGDSSWHGTRVLGILGALTDNAVGIAGMTWEPYLLPVRALGKCGGYDSDIITGMQWAAGMPVTGVPVNPYPADIVNLSLGGSGACPSAYADAVGTLTGMGVLIVASAGNGSVPPATAAVDAPANCPGVLAVAGLRNVGTKVGYSSLGSEVGVAAPAGNCVNASGPCLKSIDTTSNTGLTVPADSTYTDEINPNLGTSFSAPIVAGIAALMRAVNANLTPAQLIARIESSAVAFPQPAGLPVCPAADPTSGECACPNDHSECGAGMVNALNAVTSALRPIAAVAVPTGTRTGGSAVLDAGGSAAACGRSIVAYSWVVGGGVTLQPGTAGSARVTVTPQGTAGSLTLTVTDSAGATDTATLAVAADGAITAAAATPAAAGSAAGACPAAQVVTVAAPTVSAAFAPATVGENAATTLTLTLANSNGFALTQTQLSETLPAGVVMAGGASSATSGAPATTCGGAGSALTVAAGGVTLSGAIIPAAGSCVITIPVQSATPGTYTAAVAASALTTAPAGSNTQPAAAALTVSAPSSGGGALDWWDTLFVVGVLLAGRRGVKRKPPEPRDARAARLPPKWRRP